jgi:outer membrane protein assembly factor BamB
MVARQRSSSASVPAKGTIRLTVMRGPYGYRQSAMLRAPLLGVLAAALCACGGHARATATPTAAPATATATASASGPAAWTRFDYDAARSGVAPAGADVARLQAQTVAIDGTVDSSPILIKGVLIVTTTYGRTLGLDPVSGRTRWRFTPGSYRSLAGSYRITNATPVGDARTGAVYAASPDGRVHRLDARTGREIRRGGWPVSVTRDPTREKIASALNLDGRYVLVTTGGYVGDAPPYQGKVVAIDRTSGRIAHVWNSLCSTRRAVIAPSSCPASDSAIWGRGGAVVDPVTHRIYVATGNGPFDGRADWGDSTLELAPAAARLLRSYTPRNQRTLDTADADLGSASPALLPSGSGRGTAFILQGGKDDRLRLLSLRRSLHRAGPRLGGEVQVLPQPGGQNVFGAPAVWHRGSSTQVFVATNGGTAAYRLAGGRLVRTWSNGHGGTSPVVAGGLLYVYDPAGALYVYRPGSGAVVRRFGVPSGHWNSPIVAGGRVYLPVGDANDHRTSGQLVILR